MHKDKLYHFAACAIVALVTSFTMLFLHGTLAISLLSGALSGIAIGVGKEYGDSKAVGNKWDWYDILADAIGAFVGSAVGVLLTFVV